MKGECISSSSATRRRSCFPGRTSEDIELEKMQTLCAILSRILYWKTLMLLISFYTCIVTVAAFALIVLFEALPFGAESRRGH